MSCRIDCLKCVESDWYHKWCPLYNYRLNDYVKGPLKFPMVTIPIPCEIKEKDKMDRCDCAKYLKECYSKPGIPDPWSEYLILRKETEKGRDVSSDFPKCDLDITRYLDRNYRVYLGQGIPDPWKKWTRLRPPEPGTDDLRQNCKSYIDNLRIGPGCDKYDFDEVCCPNCDRQLLVMCLKKSSREEKEVEKEVANNDSVSKPIEEKLVEQKIPVKDACVETDYLPHVRNNEVQTSETCSCGSNKICNCNGNCSSCPVCNKSKNEERTERGLYKKSDSCFNCKKNYIKNWYFYTAGPNYPMRMKNVRHRIPVQDQGDGRPLRKLDFGRQGTVLPFFCNRTDRCVCSAQHFIGFEEKNNHGLELQLICPECERKRKKRRQHICGQREENRFPRPCRNNEGTGFQKCTREYGCDCCVCYRARRALHFKERVKPNTSCAAEDRCRCHSGDADKTGIFGDRDYVRLLEILGCTGLFSDKPDMIWGKSKTTNNCSKGKRRSFSRPDHSRRTDNTTDVFGRIFHDWGRGWTDHKSEKYEVGRRANGRKNELETVQKDPKCSKKYRNPNCSFDEVRKMRNHLRSQKSRNAFRKELSCFLSNCRGKGLSNGSGSSSESRLGELSGEMEAGHSSWKKGAAVLFEESEPKIGALTDMPVSFPKTNKIRNMS